MEPYSEQYEGVVAQNKYYTPSPLTPVETKNLPPPPRKTSGTEKKSPPPIPDILKKQTSPTDNTGRKTPPIPSHLQKSPIETVDTKKNVQVEQTITKIESATTEDEMVLQGSAAGDAVRAEEKQPSIKELLLKTGECLKEAFPSYAELTAGDITIGLASVAVEHKKQNALQKLYNEPCLFQIDESDADYKSFKRGKVHDVNPEGISDEKFLLAERLLNFANFVYYPIVEPVKVLSNAPLATEAVVAEEDYLDVKHYVLMGELKGVKDAISGESITKKKEHANVRAHLIENLVQFRCESEHLQNAFFTKLDFDLGALIISVRGTDSIMDAFTNFTANPTPLSVHKFYDTDVESQKEEMIEGVVHKGKLDAARWVVNQNEHVLKELFYEPEEKKEPTELDKKKQKINRIICVGHSLGAAVATLTGVELREKMLASKDKLKNKKLPPINVITYASSAFVSYPLSRWCRQFVDTFIIGSDIVPRVSVGQAERLRLEISESNYQTKVEQYLKEHSGVASVVGKINNFMTGRGFNPLLNVKIPEVTAENGEKTVETVQETATTTEQGDTKVEETTTKVTTTENSEVTEETKVSYEIETLYPAGNLYLFIEEATGEVEKDFGSMLLKFLEQKFKDEDEEKQKEGETTPTITATSLIKSWWNSKSPTDEKTKTVVKKVGKSVQVVKEQTRRKFVVRHVDAKHFDRIILSPNMFKDHRLSNYYDALAFIEEEIGAKEKVQPQVQRVRIAPLPSTNTTH